MLIFVKKFMNKFVLNKFVGINGKYQNCKILLQVDKIYVL